MAEGYQVTRIVGFVLVQNEESFVTWAISNVLEFCDEIIVMENNSTDATWERIEALAARHPKIRAHRVANAGRTNEYAVPFVGQDVWLFGVDGDEIYDPLGLARFRKRVLEGEFRTAREIRGHTVHARTIDLDAQSATGFVTPAAKAATKFYYAGAIDSWHANTQRLHGRPVYKEGWEAAERVHLAATQSWEEADLRMLHLCFFPRSTINPDVAVRQNITDRSFRNIWRRPVFSMLEALGLGRGRVGEYVRRLAGIRKPQHYAVGDIEERSIAGFGRPADFGLPGAEAVERQIAEITERRRADPAELVRTAEKRVSRAASRRTGRTGRTGKTS